MTTLKAKNEARLLEARKQDRRKKNTLILIQQHLLDHGYIESAQHLQRESGLSLEHYQVADNVDLLSILQEYENFFTMKFQKRPTIVRKVNGSGVNLSKKDLYNQKRPSIRRNNKNDQKNDQNEKPKNLVNTQKHTQTLPKLHKGFSTSTSHSSYSSQQTNYDIDSTDAQPMMPNLKFMQQDFQSSNVSSNPARSSVVPKQRNNNSPNVENNDHNYNKMRSQNIIVKPLRVQKQSHNPNPNINRGIQEPEELQQNENQNHEEQPVLDNFENKVIKPIPVELRANSELRELATLITRDIFTEDPDVHWNDIAGLNESKRILKEAVVMPVKYPELFRDLLQPWKGLLLFGP